MLYLGVRKRTWDTLRKHLPAVRLGTSLIYDIRDLDALFDELKARAAQQPESGAEQGARASGESNTAGDTARASTPAPDGFARQSLAGTERPSATRKGVKTWAVPQGSTRTRNRVAGESTSFSGVDAFKAVIALAKKPKAGS